MINVIIDRRKQDGRIISFRVSGHAGYAEPGKDLVCAGVSTVTVGTVNAIEVLLRIELPARVESGLLEASIPDIADEATGERVQLLLESMIVMLRSIQEAYGDVGKFIRIQERANRSSTI